MFEFEQIIYFISLFLSIYIFFNTNIKLDTFTMSIIKKKKNFSLINIIKIHYFYTIYFLLWLVLLFTTNDNLILYSIIILIPLWIIFSMFDISKLWLYIRYWLKENDYIEYEKLKFNKIINKKVVWDKYKIIHLILYILVIIISLLEYTKNFSNDLILISPLLFATFYYFSSFDTKYKNIPDRSFLYLTLSFLAIFFISSGIYQYEYYFSFLAISIIMIFVGIYETISERQILWYMDIPILFFLVMILNTYSLMLIMILSIVNIVVIIKNKKEKRKWDLNNNNDTYPFYSNLTYVFFIGLLLYTSINTNLFDFIKLF